MEQELGAAGQLGVIDGAPKLNKAATVRERALGVVSVAVLLAGLAGACTSGVPAVVGVLVLAAALLLMIAWSWFHLGATRRRPHTKAENAAIVFATMMLGAPGSKILWDDPAPLGASLVAAALPTAGLLFYLVLRWRR
ncbi:hypothetical protein [Streptomyces alboflavus]|uniref:hypothetical protein n=1 Tax=Streptomyces alboflavus TaxID=67267 RepID=UPI000A55C5C8|nr:hypothetical protein [Streptomyces alboflavus]